MDGFNPSEETVTEEFVGRDLSTSWGYNQTNVDLARIVDVSESGKTVLAKMVRKNSENNGTENEVTASDETYGDTFRLHVRAWSDKPSFRGSYPFCEGSTRLDSFTLLEGSVRETAAPFGH